MCRRLKGVVLMALQRGMRQDMNAPPEIDKRMSNLGTMPRLLCWKCRKLTPFDLDRCEHCGSALAGCTGGVYAHERNPRPRPTRARKPASVPRRRPLLGNVEQ